MNKLIFAMALAAISSHAAAEWQQIEATPDVTIYIDPTTVKKSGNNASLWILLDYQKPQMDKTGKKVLSDKVQYQYDCKKKQYQVPSTSAHSGNMGGGEIININPDPPKMTPINEGSLDETLWQRACGTNTKKKAN